MLQHADMFVLATPVGNEGESTAPVTSTPVAERRAPQAGMGVLEGVGEALCEVLLLGVTLGVTLGETLGEGETLGVTETEGVMEDEKEGCAGPTKTVLPLVATTPVQLASSKQVLVKVWKTKAVVLTVVAFCCLVTFWKMAQQAETLALATPAG